VNPMQMLAANPFEFKGKAMMMRFGECTHCAGHPAVFVTRDDGDETMAGVPDLGSALRMALATVSAIFTSTEPQAMAYLPDLGPLLRTLGDWVEGIDATLDAEAARLGATVH
jgi:hypothetical protein